MHSVEQFEKAYLLYPLGGGYLRIIHITLKMLPISLCKMARRMSIQILEQ